MREPTSAVDQIITEAQMEGKFADLAGKGQPLVIDPSPDAVVKGILKQANVSMTPEWITLAMEIDRLLEEYERSLAAYAEAYAADRAAVEAAAVATLQAPDSPPAPEPWWRRRWRALTRGAAGEGGSRLTAHRSPLTAADAMRQQWERELAGYAGRLHEGNRKIRRFNLIVPLANRQYPLLSVPQRLDDFARRFPLPERAPEGGWRFIPGVVPEALLTPPQGEPREGRQRDVIEAVALKRMRERGRQPPPIG